MPQVDSVYTINNRASTSTSITPINKINAGLSRHFFMGGKFSLLYFNNRVVFKWGQTQIFKSRQTKTIFIIWVVKKS